MLETNNLLTLPDLSQAAGWLPLVAVCGAGASCCRLQAAMLSVARCVHQGLAPSSQHA